MNNKKFIINRYSRNMIRVHKKLSNNQHALVEFHIYDNNLRWGNKNKTENPYVVISISFVISKNKKYCNNYGREKSRFHKKMHLNSTGRTGLEGLKWFADCIKHMEKYFFDKYKISTFLIIEWDDEKRMKAYRRLEKYGFIFEEGWSHNINGVTKYFNCYVNRIRDFCHTQP